MGSIQHIDSLTPSEIIQVQLQNDALILVEVRNAGGREKVAHFGVPPISDLINSIESLSSSIANSLKKISPDKFTVEFGVEASLQSGKLLALLCSGGGKANLTIKLEWEKKSDATGISQ